MKIAILTAGRLPVPATEGGAVETLIDMYLDYNERHGLHDITVYSIPPKKSVPDAKGHLKHTRYVYRNPHTLLNRLMGRVFEKVNTLAYYDRWTEWFLVLCARDMRKRHYDCIIIENRPAFAMRMRKTTKTQIVLRLENDYLHPEVPLAAKIREACTGILACSDFIRKRVESVETFRTDRGRCLTVWNGIDVNRFRQATPVSKTSLGLGEDDFVVFFSGRLTPEKGILELIQAVRQTDDTPRLRLVIVGASFYGTDKEASPFMLQLQEEARSIQDKVVFTGYVDYQKMPSYLKMADVAVVPSMWEEPFGLTVAEALAAGRPLVATRSGAIGEICQNCALLINKENAVAELAASITRLYHHPEEARRLAKMAEERSLLFDKEVYARNYFEALSALLAKKQES